MNKIGLAVITYNRPNILEHCLECLDSVGWGGASMRFVVVDEPYDIDKYAKFSTYDMRYADKNGGVAAAKNRALVAMLDGGCEHLFLIEDDIGMLSNTTCEDYVAYAAKKGVGHLNFAHHGSLNEGRCFYYGGICCYPHCVGAFSYYRRDLIERVGFLDEMFFNAWEHIEHTYRITQVEKRPPFWFFADHPNSKSMFKDLDPSLALSVIRADSLWGENVRRGEQYWRSKYGTFLPKRPKRNRLWGYFSKVLRGMQW